MTHALKNAVLSAILTALLAVPILGLKLTRENGVIAIDPDFTLALWGCLIVFLVQLFVTPLLKKVNLKGKYGKPINLNLKPIQMNTILLLILVALFVWPFFGNRVSVDIATLVLIYVMLGLGLNIVVGFAGLLDLGFVGFYAVGAYTYALLFYYFDWSFWQALPLAGLFAAGFGFLLGFPVLRLRGDYLAIVTLGFGEIIRLLLINLVSITRGPDGISSIPKPTVFGYPMQRRAPEGQETFHQLMGWKFDSMDSVIYLYLLALILAILTLLLSNRLLRMPVGRAWEALREDEIACKSLGLNPTKIKLSAFTLGAMCAGFAGAFFAARQGLVNPEAFTFMESAMILAIVVLGGMGSQIGVIFAAIILTVLPELARQFAEYRMLIFGLVMVLMMIWRPQGLFPVKRPHVEVSA